MSGNQRICALFLMNGFIRFFPIYASLPEPPIDPNTISRIAQFSSADTLVWGQYARFGGQIRIDATLAGLKHDRNVPSKSKRSTKKTFLGRLTGLAAEIRNNLAFSPDIVNELKASSFQPSSHSSQACEITIREFNRCAKASI